MAENWHKSKADEFLLRATAETDSIIERKIGEYKKVAEAINDNSLPNRYKAAMEIIADFPAVVEYFEGKIFELQNELRRARDPMSGAAFIKEE